MLYFRFYLVGIGNRWYSSIIVILFIFENDKLFWLVCCDHKKFHLKSQSNLCFKQSPVCVSLLMVICPNVTPPRWILDEGLHFYCALMLPLHSVNKKIMALEESINPLSCWLFLLPLILMICLLLDALPGNTQ